MALSQVTDEFIAYIRARADSFDLDQASYFLVVAATLLDLKAARLLPAGEVEDEEDLALLEARDLLFARLLQYRAYKEVAGDLRGPDGRAGAPVRPAGPDGATVRRAAARGAAGPRPGRVRPHRRGRARPTPGAGGVHRAHPHAPHQRPPSRRTILARRLRELHRATFRELISDCAGTYEVVARFLAVLELYREGNVALEQAEPLGDLYVTWAPGAHAAAAAEEDG